MFSIAFDHNTSQVWVINFGITIIGDICVKEVIIAVL